MPGLLPLDRRAGGSFIFNDMAVSMNFFFMVSMDQILEIIKRTL